MKKFIEYFRKHYYICYTFISLAMCIAVFGIFIYNGKSFVWTGDLQDGLAQHYTAYLYYGRYLRTIVRSILFDHNFSIPSFSMSIGYGSDILDTLHYYVIGDPICVLTVFVPSNYMLYFYDFSILLRLWLSGLSFSKLCFYMNGKREKKVSKTAIMIGAFIYVFCGYALFASVRHPYFINPMIYFPLVLLGVEMILDKGKPYVFTLAVFLSAISNFYFFYMIVILTVFYVGWRLIARYKRLTWKTAIGRLCKISVYSLLGTAMSAIVLVPMLLCFAGDVRSESGYVHDALYTLEDYQKTISGFVAVNTHHDWIYLGYGVVALFAVFLLFLHRKKHNDIKAAFVLMSIMLLLPVISRIMNGYSYVCNRWVFGFSLLVGYIVVIMWDDLMNATGKEKLYLFLCLCGYFALCMIMTQSRTTDFFFAMILAFIFLYLISMKKSKYANVIKVACILCVFASIAGNAYLMYSMQFNDYISEFADSKNFYNNYTHTEANALEALTDENQFSRYTGEITKNRTLYTGLHSTQYYWSLSNGNITNFLFENDLNYSSPEDYIGLDSRTIFSTLANVRYYIKDSEDETSQCPYGYKSIGSVYNYKNLSDFLINNLGKNYDESSLTDREENILKGKYLTNYTIYKNKNSLPFGYTYKNCLSRDAYEKLSPVEKQEAMMQVIVIDNVENKEEIIPTYTSSSLHYSVESSEGAQWDENTITVTEEKSTVTINILGEANCENYLYIKNLAYQEVPPTDKYIDADWALESTFNKNEEKYEKSIEGTPTAIKLNISSKNQKNKDVSTSITYRTEYNNHYNNHKDYLINLYYSKSPITTITITFPTIGVYSYDDLEVICQPMDNYKNQVKALKVDTLENVDFHDDNAAFATNEITGEISLDQEKYLLMTIPYSNGWTAYVDGEEQELLQANTMYMALKLNAGYHSIELKYHTPGLSIGLCISLVAFIIFLIICIISENQSKKSKRFYRKKIKKRIDQ